jgi:hypothetical protein
VCSIWEKGNMTLSIFLKENCSSEKDSYVSQEKNLGSSFTECLFA